MLATLAGIWEAVKSLFGGKSNMQIGKDNQSVSGVTIGDTTGPVAVGNNVTMNYHQPPVLSPEKPASSEISPEAARLLYEASQDRHGVILKSSTLQGVDFLTNNKEFGDSTNARSVARWKAAAQELATKGFVDASTPGPSMTYRVNDAGYAAAEKITAESVQDVDISK